MGVGLGSSFLRGFVSKKCCLLGEAACAESTVNTVVFIRVNDYGKIWFGHPGKAFWSHFGRSLVPYFLCYLRVSKCR